MHWCARQGRARRYASASWCRTVTLHGGCRRRTLLSASGRCCAKEPHFPIVIMEHRRASATSLLMEAFMASKKASLDSLGFVVNPGLSLIATKKMAKGSITFLPAWCLLGHCQFSRRVPASRTLL